MVGDAKYKNWGASAENLRFLWRLVVASVLLSLIAYFAGRAQPNQGYVPFWPEGGIGLALVWRHSARYWPAVLVSNTVLSMTVGTPFVAALGVGWLQVLIVMVALKLLHRWNVHLFLSDMRQFGAFVLAIILSSALALPVYAFRVGVVLKYPQSQALAFGIDYFLTAFFSFLVFTPVIVSWSPNAFVQPLKRRLFVVSMAAIALAGWGILAAPSEFQDRLLFLLLPFVVLAAFSARVAGASTAAGLLTMVMVAMAAGTAVVITDNILRAAFVAVAALTGYLLAVVFSEREHTAAEMAYRARHDALTGLMNRYEFENRLTEALRDPARRHAVLYLDLDQFKLVNDSCGHLAGDHMLRKIADTIRASLPANAVLARLGGDEFGCLLPDATSIEAEEVARRLHDTIRAFKFSVGELSFMVGVSIGTTFLQAQDGETPDDVLGRADIACYTAKEHGRNRTHVYNPADVNMHERHEEIRELSQLQSALGSGLFELYAQRIVNLDDAVQKESFFEVLLHHSDTKSHRAIEDMLGMARRYGLIAQVDRWVFDQAAHFLQRQAGRQIRLSINVSATTLESDGFQQFVLGLPRQYGFQAKQIVIEITEAVAVQNLTRAVENLRELRRRGFEIALDDFGAGVASFGYLSELPVSMVKLDGRFVRDLGHDPAAEVVIGSLAKVAALRGLVCIAEWVEDATVLPRLRALGVHYAQGYAIHRPSLLATLEGAELAVH